MSINFGVISGHLTRNPVAVGNETPIALMTVASNRNQEKADFIEVKAIGKIAETLLNNVQKGDKVTFSYRLESSQYPDQSGQMVYRQDVVISKAEF
jgi:single-stranded DNA-binding protein